MSTETQGIVEVVKMNEEYKLWSFKVGDTYFGAGKFEPKFSAGDEIKFTATQKGKYWNLDFGSVEVLEKGKASPAVGATSGPKAPTNWDLKDKRITYMACRNSALSLITAAVASDSVPLPTKKGDRLEALELMVDEKTKEYYEDIYATPFEGEAVAED